MTTQTLARAISARRVRRADIAASLPMLGILLLQAIVSLSLRNTAFQDEGLYLYAGRQYFVQLIGGPAVTEPYGLYFSGLPQLYPVLAGALDYMGGLELARMLSLACMLAATASVAFVGRRLFDRESGLLGAALFAVQGSVLFLGRLATYDALCLSLLAGATALAVRAAGERRWHLPALLLGPALMLAVASKYAGLLFVPPVLAVLALQSWHEAGWRRAAVRLAIPLAVMAVAGGLALLLLPGLQEALVGLRATTTNRVALLVTPRGTLALRALEIGGPMTALALAGLALRRRSRPLIGMVLLGAALLAPAYHIYKAEVISMHKHIAFGLFFAAPLAGVAVARLAGLGRRRVGLGDARWLAGLAACLLVFALGLRQAQGFYSEWANSDELISVLRTQVRPGSGRILAEEAEVPRYYLQGLVAFWQWNHLYWFYYTDKAGRHLQGAEAYKAAIAEGYFDVVVLRYGPNADMARQIDGDLKAGRGYEQIAKLPYHTVFGQGDYWIWRRTGIGGQP
jgi:4-amino-4-deoxy-L-arabinose transferase-like glycosyltransferase